MIYAKVFPQFWHKLEKHYYESQKALLTKMHDALIIYGSQMDEDMSGRDEEGTKLARQTVENMVKQRGYCENCAKEVIIFLMKQRY